jgi:hypothetical protein
MQRASRAGARVLREKAHGRKGRCSVEAAVFATSS